MNITVSKSDLSRVLGIANSIVEKRSTIPILSNVLLSATEEGTLKISATNLELTTVLNCKAEVASGGSTTVNARVFTDIVKELPDTDIVLELKDRERLEIRAGKSNFKMVGVSSEEFPSLPGVGLEISGKMRANQLLEMVNRTIFAVSHDETRFNLNGVCFEYIEPEKKKDPGLLRMVATDGHRLALITREAGELSFTGNAIVPTKGLAEVRRILDEEGDGEVGVDILEGFFIVEAPNARVSMRLIDGEFPDYNQVLPKQDGIEVQIPSAALTQALRRTALMVTDRGKCVKFDFSEGNLRLSSSSPELGEASEELEIVYKGDPLSVGFNAKYLLDFLATLEEGQLVLMELNGELGPGKLQGQGDDSYLGIVMPMRLA